MKRPLLVQGMLWGLFALGFAAILHFGGNLPPIPPAPRAGIAAVAEHPWRVLQENPGGSLARLLLQFAVILAATRSAGFLFRKCGLPVVVGEITAGILLGPSLLGWVWPQGFNFIFTAGSIPVLRLFSQIGVTVFMFVVGMELEVDNLRETARATVLTSQISIFVPYLVGMASALFLYADYAGAGTSFAAFALFLGIAMSITAFPVLVRILKERGMMKTPLGSFAIACAAIGDAGAWIILALVVAFARGKGMDATLFRLGLVAILVLAMVGPIRRRLPHWLDAGQPGRKTSGGGNVAVALLFMAGSALATEALGIHALFGAFLAGAVMPRQRMFRDHLVTRLQNFGGGLLLPLFFAFSGLRTHIGLLGDRTSWLVCLAIVTVATAGKLGGSMLAGRLNGMRWSDAFVFGSLMNTRGLMELIALNVGYDLGVLSPSIFAMLVLMALVTTFLTGPLLNLSKQSTQAAA